MDKVENDAEIMEIFGPEHKMHEKSMASPKTFDTTPTPSEGRESPVSPEIQDPIGDNSLGIVEGELEEVNQEEMQQTFLGGIAEIMMNQSNHDSSNTWTEFVTEFRSAQSLLIKDTLKNFLLSRGLKNQAEQINLEVELDLDDERVQHLLNLGLNQANDEKMFEKFDRKISQLATKEALSAQIVDMKVFEKTLDNKIRGFQKTMLHEIELIKAKPLNHPIGVGKDEIVRMIKESRTMFMQDAKRMTNNTFPNGHDEGLQTIVNKNGNLSLDEIYRSRAAIAKFCSESVMCTLTQIVGYGSENEGLSIEAESAFLKKFLQPLSAISPEGRYSQQVIFSGIQTAWCGLMSFLTNPGMINSRDIISLCKTIYYACRDSGCDNFQFTKNVGDLCIQVSVPPGEQITNLDVIQKLQSLIPINISTNWSYRPFNNPKDVSRTMANWNSSKVNKLVNRAYADCQLEGDTLSTKKAKLVFPTTNPYEHKIVKKRAPDHVSCPETSQGTSGFFSNNIKGYY